MMQDIFIQFAIIVLIVELVELILIAGIILLKQIVRMQPDALGVAVVKKGVGVIQILVYVMLQKTGMEKIARGILQILIVSKMDVGNIITRVIALILE